MRILVTGASGWIGSASVKELISSGHHVLGLARNDAAAAKIARLGAEVVHGSLDDLASLRSAATLAEGVVALHDVSLSIEPGQVVGDGGLSLNTWTAMRQNKLPKMFTRY